jgi:hypothetical protein
MVESMRYSITLLLAPLLLSACMSNSKIQSRYNVDQATCQGIAEQNIDYYLPKDRQVSGADRNAQMVTLFSDCMGKGGWQVGKPKKKKDDEVTSSAPSTPPAKTESPAPASAAPAAPPQRSTPETTPMSPAGVVPPPSPITSPPAVYQPVYGTGPGRNF